MADSLGIGAAGAAAGSALDRQTDSLLRGFNSPAKAPASTAGATAGKAGKIVDKVRDENAKMDKSARDFESILLGSWLEQAEQSFAKVPGGEDDDEDADPGGEQLKGMATQSLAASLAASGGIGLARMISAQMHKAADTQTAAAQPGAGEPARSAGPAAAKTGPSPPGAGPGSPPGRPAK